MLSHLVPGILLLCGPIRVGKTTLCQRWLCAARKAGWRVGGILAPARWDDGSKKNGINVIDLETGERHQLATIVHQRSAATVGEYCFCQSSTRWALDGLLRALRSPLDLVIIDEIGRLELEHGGGYAPALDAIANAQCKRVLIIVRDSLADALAERLAPLPCRRIDVSPAVRDVLAESGIEILR